MILDQMLLRLLNRLFWLSLVINIAETTVKSSSRDGTPSKIDCFTSVGWKGTWNIGNVKILNVKLVL